MIVKGGDFVAYGNYIQVMLELQACIFHDLSPMLGHVFSNETAFKSLIFL